MLDAPGARRGCPFARRRRRRGSRYPMQRSSFSAAAVLAAQLALCTWPGVAGAATNQTPTLTPLAPASELPFRVEMRPVDVGSMAMPTLHSYTAAQYDGKWILFGGRTNGLHGFEQSGAVNFPPAS